MKTYIAAILTLIVVPFATSADEYQNFLQDIELLEEEIQTMEAAQERVQFEADYQSTEDIFPRGAKYEQELGDTRVTTDVSDTYVYTRVNDIPVVLRDVPLDTWFAPYVRDMNGIISGYTDPDGTPRGLYGPGDAVTRGQLAKIAIKASGRSTDPCPAESINEGIRGSWAELYVSCAETYRFAIFQDSSLDMNAPATRAEVIVTVLQAFNIEVKTATQNLFSDVPEGYVFADAIETAATMGIISGYKDKNDNQTNLVGPLNSINRAEIAKVVSLTMQVSR